VRCLRAPRFPFHRKTPPPTGATVAPTAPLFSSPRPFRSSVDCFPFTHFFQSLMGGIAVRCTVDCRHHRLCVSPRTPVLPLMDVVIVYVSLVITILEDDTPFIRLPIPAGAHPLYSLVVSHRCCVWSDHFSSSYVFSHLCFHFFPFILLPASCCPRCPLQSSCFF